MKGIYGIYSKKSHVEFGVFATENLEKAKFDYNEGIMPLRSIQRAYDKGIVLSFEVLMETDDLKRKLSEYVWPQIQRIVYSEKCVNNIEQKGYIKKVRKIIDWFITSFAKEYSILIDEMDNGDTIGTIIKNGILEEVYVFNKSGIPVSRTSLE